ncbi:MAG: hypothetical protein ACE5JL_14770, partial [Dehalococcoidia bacterium]
LYWLCDASRAGRENLDRLAHLLLDRQEASGGWTFSTLQIGETTPSGLVITERNQSSAMHHTTLVAITGLYCYLSLITDRG